MNDGLVQKGIIIFPAGSIRSTRIFETFHPYFIMRYMLHGKDYHLIRLISATCTPEIAIYVAYPVNENALIIRKKFEGGKNISYAL